MCYYYLHGFRFKISFCFHNKNNSTVQLLLYYYNTNVYLCAVFCVGTRRTVFRVIHSHAYHNCLYDTPAETLRTGNGGKLNKKNSIEIMKNNNNKRTLDVYENKFSKLYCRNVIILFRRWLLHCRFYNSSGAGGYGRT